LQPLVTSAVSREVFSCVPDDDVATAEKLMREKQVHRLPVVDTQGSMAGLISVNGVARETAQEADMKKNREVSDAEIARVMASVCAPRHQVVQAAA
jgi:predicted transcriptional regulator